MSGGFFFEEQEFLANRKVRRPAVAASGCDGCGLHRRARTPRMVAHGGNGLSIVVVGEAPGRTEDEDGVPFCKRGRSGKFLRDILTEFGVDLDRDCVTVNAVSCRPSDEDDRNREPTDQEVRACLPRLDTAIAEARPDMILALGTVAIGSVLSDAPPGIATTATVMHGRVIPSRKHGCWVACGFHPSFYVREEGRHDGRMREMLANALDVLAERGIPPLLDESAFEIVEDTGELKRLLTRLGDGTAEVAVDFETTGLDPWDPDFKLLTVSVTDTPDFGWCVPMYHPHACWGDRDALVWDLLGWFLADSPCPKVIQNWQYEELVTRVYMGREGVRNVVCDTMLREHVLDNRKGVSGQEFQEYIRYGVTGHKGRVNVARLKNEWLDDVARYNTLDVRYCLQWKRDQDRQMTPDLERAYGLFHDATPVLASMTQRGIRVDQERLSDLSRDVRRELDVLSMTVSDSDCLRLFRERYGHDWSGKNPGDNKKLFFGVLGFSPLKATKSFEGSPDWADSPESCSSDADSLRFCMGQAELGSAEHNLLRWCLDSAKLEKLYGTYIKAIGTLVKSDGCLHPRFHLNTVQTYRSSSSDPNFQFFPKRDKDMSRVRRVMVPRFDVFLEADFSGAEVRTMACRTRDPLLCKNVRDGVDFHRYYAALLYGKDERDVTKEERFDGKNGFVFPEFYGSRARGINRNQPQWPIGRIEAVERKLWRDMPAVGRWQDEAKVEYYRDGWVEMLTGFLARFGDSGFLSDHQILNYPIQGPSFHRLLQAAVDVEAEMRRRKMRSELVGQIHDSLVTDCVREELEDVVELQRAIMTRDVWDWCKAIPWEVEMSIGPNLIDMEEVPLG